MSLSGKTILLGVTGGVAIYKAVDMCSKLTQLGALVDVIMTDAAREFVTPLLFAAVTNRTVYFNPFEAKRKPEHISLAQRPDVIVVAPATANTLAKVAHGIADNLLTATLLASKKPVLFAPAMNVGMWEAPVTQENIAVLEKRGYRFISPGTGYLACGDIGAGRMAEPKDIISALEGILGNE